ncbi:MAG: polysaccharide biosynthesis protein [Planctomycetaceae bacterium]|nr:polysaccharide biosynthesis protein [Planctomycetaceae bacterium]
MIPATSAPDRPPSSVLRKLLVGTFWYGLKSPLQVVLAFWSIPLIQHAIGSEANGAYVFAWGFGFLGWILELGMNSALQRQVTDAWSRGDRAGVDRLIACGTTYYAAMSLVQVALLGAIATFGLPPKFQGESRRLIVGLLWLQAFSSPFFGLLNVITSVLQAARRYDFLPRLDLVVVVSRFAILVLGLRAGVDFFAIVVAQMTLHLAILLTPSLWVMVHELGFVPHFGSARRADYATLLQVGVYVFLIQLSIALGDKVDTTVLGYALAEADPGPSITVYQNVSKPFLQIRQTGWTLAHLILPAVASLAAARDVSGLERIKYDGPRLLIGVLAPVALLAGIYAGPFLCLWVGPDYAPYAPLLRLFLVATLPLMLWVHAQMAIGMGRADLVALPLLVGSLVNLPLSYVLTTRLGVSGVIWGTVLTTLVANLLVLGVGLFRLLGIRPTTFLVRTLSAPLLGAAFLVATTWACRAVLSPDPAGTTPATRSLPLIIHLTLGSLAYLAGYLATPVGRADLVALVRLHRL